MIYNAYVGMRGIKLMQGFQRRIPEISQICIFSAIMEKIRDTPLHKG
jgi:hypothetical protein